MTTLGRDDALALVRDRVFEDGELPSIAVLIEDVDVSTLDAGHVLPNRIACGWSIRYCSSGRSDFG